ncbi:MAG: hypothetical protein K0B15_04835 [Lentimicrobium sp.]|nr:hypothetical protein [Lentimicrobium sp.]
MEKKIKKIELYRTNVVLTDPDEAGDLMEEMLISEIFYDEDGNETERITYSPSGDVEEYIITKYEKGQPIEEILELEGEVAERTTREFDDSGVLLREFRHYQDGEPDEISYVYENGKPVQKVVTDSDGEEGEKYTWHYVDGKILKEESFDEYGTTDFIKTYTYSGSGLLEETEEIRVSNGEQSRLVSLYDEKGNMVQEKRYDARGNLRVRITTAMGDNNHPAQTEEETILGKTISVFGWDEHGNNTKLTEQTAEGEVISVIERNYDESGLVQATEVKMEPALNRPGQHYTLRYAYSFYD